MRVGLITTIRGRLGHLEAQLRWLARSTRPPDAHVVVWMGGEDPRALVRRHAPSARVVPLEVRGPLPLARARNRGATAAAADVLVFLDVDCLPSPHMVSAYADAVRPDEVAAGPVGYLPACLTPPAAHPDRTTWRELTDRGTHPTGRPTRDGAATIEPRIELLWSLSMAITAPTFEAVGGFDEGYVGYGGEDTDLALRLRDHGVALRWCPAAEAVHLHHPVQDPPIAHLEDIVANARRFRSRWGSWPMPTWLQGFADLGLVGWNPEGERLELLERAVVEGSARP